MSWPLVSDFSRMLKNPKVALREQALKTCTIELDQLGQPRARSGNFATVFRAYREDGSELALRVFNRQADARRDAYQARSRYMAGREVNSIVPFTYDEKGIRSASDGKLYPLLTMDWVPGVTLFEWVRDRCREQYQEALAIAADVWLYLVRELAENGVVHGDLQHGNVMVSPEGHFKLVDYDCLAVPELMGQPNLELGLPPYQHPKRNERTRMFPGLDNFSALVIYVSLRALAAAPHLWTTHVEQTSYDKLLFRSSDFDDPATSSLYADLLNSPDQQVRDLAYYLFKLTEYELEDVPPIDEVLLWCNSLEDLLARKDWDTAVQLVERMGADEPVPEALLPQIEKARRRVAARVAVEEALRLGDEHAVQRYFVPDLFHDYPAAAELVEEAKHAGQVVQVLEALGVARRFGKWDLFRDLWNTHHAILTKRASARQYREEVKKIWAADSVARLLADPKASDQAVVDAWKYFQSLGGHPTGDGYAQAVKTREERLAAATRLQQWIQRSPPSPTSESDRQLTDAWRVSGLDGAAGHESVARPCREARERLGRMARIGKLASTATVDGEREIVELSSGLPPDYHPNLARRRRRAKLRLAALATLHAALKEPRSDMAIVEGWKKVVRAKADGMVSEQLLRRIALAERRVPVLKALSAIDVRLTDAEMDRRLLEIWDERLLTGCHDAKGWLPRYEAIRARQNLLSELARAIEQVDRARIDELLEMPSLRGYPLGEELRRGIDEVDEKLKQRRLAHRQSLVRALLEGQPGVFADQFEDELVRDICRELPHHQALAQRWTELEILPRVREAMKPTAEQGLKRDGKTVYSAEWRWPPANLSRRQIIAVCPDAPRLSAVPDDVEKLYQSSKSRGDGEPEAIKHMLVVPPEWAGATVVVWAVVDLGFQLLHTEPLELGRIEEEEKPKRWGLFG